MKLSLSSSVLCLLVSAAAFGCARSPEPSFFALAPQSGTPTPSPALKIELRRPELPQYLDSEHVVRRSSPEQLQLSESERWGAPLDELVGTTIADDLSQRLPNCSVFAEGGAISAKPDVVVELGLSRFEMTPDGNVQLRAQSAVHFTGDPSRPSATQLQQHSLVARPADSSTAAVIASMSALLAQLSDQIAHSILSGPSAPAPAQSSSNESRSRSTF